MVKAAGGFFTVRGDNGKNYLCKARGILKRGDSTLTVGDWVLFHPEQQSGGQSETEGIIEKVRPRTNLLQRPPVANIDQLVVVMSHKDPSCDWQLISRLLVLAEKEELSAIVCLNKSDLLFSDEVDNLQSFIQPYPYPVIFTSAKENTGLSALQDHLINKCSVFAGPSGVGKSSLLNAMQPGLSLQTGMVSDKIKRGRHTTRQAELLDLNFGGSVVDTPGFTRLDLQGIFPETLPEFFPELLPYIGKCAFRDCRHMSEPKCAVLKEVGKAVNPMRYEHYRYFAEEISEGEVY